MKIPYIFICTHYNVYYLVDKEKQTIEIVRIFYSGRDVENIIRYGFE